jgi:excisionase family DNA binding protein
MAMEEELMTTREVADIFKVEPNTVYQMRQRGILHAVDLGIKSIRYRKSDVMAIVEKRNGKKCRKAKAA